MEHNELRFVLERKARLQLQRLKYSFFSHCWTRASSRSKARCRGFWQVIPSWARSRPTETRLKAILNLSLINLATISRVHSAKANFICSGFFCVTASEIQLSDRPFSFGGRPNKGFAFKAPQPPRRYCANHPYTVDRFSPRTRATTSGLSPSWTLRTARSRNASSV